MLHFFIHFFSINLLSIIIFLGCFMELANRSGKDFARMDVDPDITLFSLCHFVVLFIGDIKRNSECFFAFA